MEKLKRYDSVKEVAENSDVVVTAVGKPHQIREVHVLVRLILGSW